MREYTSKKLYTSKYAEGHDIRLVTFKDKKQCYVHVVDPIELTINFKDNLYKLPMPYGIWIYRVLVNVNTKRKTISPYRVQHTYANKNPWENLTQNLYYAYAPNSCFYRIFNYQHSIAPSVCFGGVSIPDVSLESKETENVKHILNVYSKFYGSTFNHETASCLTGDISSVYTNYVKPEWTIEAVLNSSPSELGYRSYLRKTVPFNQFLLKYRQGE